MIDPNISLAVRPMQIEDPATQVGKAVNLINARNELQMAPLRMQATQQQLAAGAMENRQRQMDLEGQEKLRQVYMDVGGDPDKLFPAAVKAGVPPKALMQLQQQLLEHATAKAKLDETTLANQAAKNDQLNSLLQPVVAEADPAKQQALWDQQMQAGLAKGLVTPQDVQAHPYPGSPDGVKAYAASLMTDKWATSQGTLMKGQAAANEDARKAQLFPTQLLESQTRSQMGQRQADASKLAAAAAQSPAALAAAKASLPPDRAAIFGDMADPTAIARVGLTAPELVTSDQAAKDLAERQHHNKIEENQGQARIGVEQGRLAVERRSQGLDANGQPMQYSDPQGNPINIDPIARQIAAYKMTPASARNYSLSRGLMEQVLAVNPNFDIGVYQQRFNTMKDLAPGGKLGQQALALNTLVRHSDDLIDAVQALGNGSFTPANAGVQKLKQLFGDSAPTSFEQLKQYVAGETTKLVRGGAGTEEDVRNAAASINKANSPKQLLDALKVNFGVAGGKLQALNESVRKATGDNQYTAVDQGAASILQKRGFDTGTMKPVQAGAAKAVSTDLVHKYAVEHNIDDATAKKAFTDKGYTVQ
jgi:hypothetical protein